jgi:hypothetical protein
LLLGGGVVVATGVAVVRVWRRRAATSSTVEELTAAGPESVTMPTGSVPAVGAMDVASVAVAAPWVSPAEQVVPHSRDAEEVVESLIPPEMHAPRTDRRVDILIAVLVIAAALAVVFAIVRLG